MSRAKNFRIAVRKYEPFERAIRAQWDAFEEQARTGLALDLVALDMHALEDALFAKDGLRNGAWDVAFIATDWIASVHAQGCALDLASRLVAEPPQGYPEDWTPSLLGLQRIGEAVLGIPYHDGPECLIYRRDLFEDPHLREAYLQQFGEALAPPATWRQFHRIARFLHRPEKGIYGTIFAAFPDGHNSVYDFLLQLWSRGGDLFLPDGSVRFESDEAAWALKFYRAMLLDSEAVHPDCATLDSIAAGMAFVEGKIALMVNWFGFATLAHTSPESPLRGLVQVAEIPRGDDAGSPGSTASLNVYWILSIASGSLHPEVAWRLLRHILSPEMDKLTTTSGAIGCRRSTWHDPDVNAELPFYHRIEQIHSYARTIPQRADWPQIAGIIDRLVTANITSDRPAAELLREADAELRTRG